jgi:hypothetical protein
VKIISLALSSLQIQFIFFFPTKTINHRTGKKNQTQRHITHQKNKNQKCIYLCKSMHKREKKACQKKMLRQYLKFFSYKQLFDGKKSFSKV